MESAKLPSTPPKIGLFTGSFDPVTLGHLDIIERASQLFDLLYIGIFDNPAKQPLFGLDERLQLLSSSIRSNNVKLLVHDQDLTVNIAKKWGVTALVRSVRGEQDLAYEANMIYFNRQMTGVETVLLVAQPALAMISSSRIRELASYGADVSAYVPTNVNRKLREKFGKS